MVEEMCKKRVQALDIAASSFVPVSGLVSTNDGADKVVYDNTDGVILGDVGTTYGDKIADPAGSGKPDPPTC